jgi:hypothetical protein
VVLQHNNSALVKTKTPIQINFMKKILVISLFLIIAFTKTTQASGGDVLGSLIMTGGSGTYDVGKYEDTDIAVYIGNIIQYILGFLGVIFLVLLIYSGFLWMTARGESDAVSTSKDILTNAIIGLIIVLMSYVVTSYVISKLASTTTTDKGGFTTQ